MNNEQANDKKDLLVRTFPSLIPWIGRQYMDAVMKDMILYADEPDAMIGLAEMSASIEAFVDTMAEFAIEEMINILGDMMGGAFE
tara:strand:- start:711 stop:965 length:255 start_codon:yes stop_codon:yes gene_type:complete